MQSKVNYTAVGIFVMGLSIALVIAIFWLSGIANKKDYRMYLVFMHEDVGGLTVESPVHFSGVKIGYVKTIDLDENNSKLVRLELAIDPKIKITTSTYATLNMQGITGVVYINLKAETENAPLLTTLPGQTMPVIASRPSFLARLSETLPEVTTQIKNLRSGVTKVLDDENRQSFKNSLQNINQLTEELEQNPSMLVRGKQPAVKGPGE